MKKLKFGIMGAGRIAKKFSAAAKDTECAEVIAVSSKSPERAEKFAEENGIERFFGSYEEMLALPEINAVYVATTTNYHYENVMSALKAGKHVICEKSMVTTPAEAERIFSLSREKGLFVMEAMWSRFLPTIVQAKKWIDDGLIGDVQTAQCEVGFTPPRAADNRYFSKELGGGALLDIGVYGFEILTFLIGQKLLDVKTLAYMSEETGVDCTGLLALRFEKCIASVISTFLADPEDRLTISGKNGHIEIYNPINGKEAVLYVKGKEPVHCKDPGRNGFCYEIEEMCRCIENGCVESEVIPHKDTILCQKIFEICLSENKNNTVKILD